MDRDIKISIRNLYKIFGPIPDVALAYVRRGMGKAELLEKHNHVLGLQDINVDMREGEITVIMGLSGSGKSTLIRHLNRLIEPTAGEIKVDGKTYSPSTRTDCGSCGVNKCRWFSRNSPCFPTRPCWRTPAWRCW